MKNQRQEMAPRNLGVLGMVLCGTAANVVNKKLSFKRSFVEIPAQLQLLRKCSIIQQDTISDISLK